MRLAILFLLSLAASAAAAPIPGFEISVNNTGFNNGGSVYVPIQSTGINGKWKQEFVDRFIADWRPKVGRHMDYWQIVTNDTTTWANRSLNDFSDKGITYETTINIDKQALAINPNYAPWINSPFLANEDHDRQLGRFYGMNYPGHKIYFGKGNEGWNIFGTNIPAQNLFAARAEGRTGGDFKIAGERWGEKLGKGTVAFETGFAEGRAAIGQSAVGDEIIMAIEGFAPVTDYAQNQINGMKAVGIDPAQHHAHISIAQYAAGSDTDLTGPLGTPAQKRDAVLAFINGSLKTWTLNHRALARANGLADLVDAYEFRLGTHSPTADWIAFQNTSEMAQVQDAGWRTLFDASGGADASLNVEGIIGFPFSSGIFSLADWPSQFNDPYQSQAYAATHALVDFSTVPEPNAAVVLLCGVAMLLSRGRKV